MTRRGVVRFNVRIRSYETDYEGEDKKEDEDDVRSEDYKSSEHESSCS